MSKYNSKKTVINGISFDSKIEGEYYKHLLSLKAKGVVHHFTLQPEFVLLEGFTDNYGKKHLPIKYKADFSVQYADGSIKVIDIKGMETPDFKIKRKLYCSMFPQELVLLSYSKIDGGWIRVEDLKVARKERKKAKELAKGTSK